jgi:signal peptidase II|tara:strand:- start:23 stop:553 length:531 start_codon:yes stop_codon:yes gene_type:complete
MQKTPKLKKAMQFNSKKKLIYCSLITISIFLLDRFSKLYVINHVEINGNIDIFLTRFLNIYLIWNKGIAFGLLNFEQSEIYGLISGIITIISLVVLVMIKKGKDIRVYFLTFVFAGAISNLFDRYYYSAVPDFIDLHINNFHWFVFNVADIFISLGIICLIIMEIIFDKRFRNDKD